MENWKFTLLGLLLGIPLSYFVNLTTPWVKSYFKKRSLSLRERRLYILHLRYRYIKNLTKLPSMIIFPMFKYLAIGLAMLIVLVTSIGIFLLPRFQQKPLSSEVFAGFIFLLALMAAFPLIRMIDEMDDIMNFDKYREKVISKIKKLGGNPKDVDKEETE
jgi:hypothetical protein